MKYEVLKASNAIHVAHNFSLLQGQLWTLILLTTPPEDILTKDIHQIPISKIMKLLGKTRNEKYVKALLEEMSSIVTRCVINKVRENKAGEPLEDEDDQDWGDFPLFEYAIVKDNIFQYSYSQSIRKDLASPQCYSYINLLMLRKFSCKYSMFLYELCFDYKNVSQTKWLTIDLFCQYMGINRDSYESFGMLNYHVIKKAVQEVNDKSDLLISPVYQYNQFNSRKIEAIKFSVESKI
jgi:plasmid replication initiation protein